MRPGGPVGPGGPAINRRRLGGLRLERLLDVLELDDELDDELSLDEEELDDKDESVELHPEELELDSVSESELEQLDLEQLDLEDRLDLEQLDLEDRLELGLLLRDLGLGKTCEPTHGETGSTNCP